MKSDRDAPTRFCVMVEDKIFDTVKDVIPGAIQAEPFRLENQGKVNLPFGLQKFSSGSDGQRSNSFTIGFIVTSNLDEDLKDRIEAVLPEIARPGSILSVSKAEIVRSTIESWCWERIGSLFTNVMKSYARSNLAQAALRSNNHRLERVIQALEDPIRAIGQMPDRLVYRVEPAAYPVRGPSHGGDEGIRISQNLTAGIPSIKSIELFMSRDAADDDGIVNVKVTRLYCGNVICDARIPLSSIHRGWNNVQCSEIYGGNREPVHVEVTISGADARSVFPALGRPNPIREECASIGGDDANDRPLAIQVWSGLPAFLPLAGARPTADKPDMAPKSVSAAIMSRAELFHQASGIADFNTVGYEEDTKSLLVHPLGTEPTISRLRSVNVSGYRKVLAVVELRNKDAQTTEFAVCAASKISAPTLLDVEKFEFINSLDWHVFKAGEWGEFEVDISHLNEDEVDIYLMTRNRTDNYNLSWAYFRSLTLLP
ncbi:hypothetical protein FF100_20240 [Methylobacterium terricola]|uniref:Uncharacterized protein n=1 Tax=Methylobacterium terricola TaxID=2583531 RepID=A0A5C4LFI7_9HYPH|nr:DUF6212 domain-containing protein [Methylobacterium terricola]TNC11450.1 hypothetical protein FF100_20240 [Methylobacterium terricola]